MKFEELDMNNVPIMNIPQLQVTLYSYIQIAYQLLIKMKREMEGVIFNSIEEFLVFDVKQESYKMLIVNYLTALFGKRKNDKISLYNHPIKDQEQAIEQFFKTNADELDAVFRVRDKVYSHVDVDFINACKNISFDFIEKCIDFLRNVLDIKQEVNVT